MNIIRAKSNEPKATDPIWKFINLYTAVLKLEGLWSSTLFY